MDKVQEPRQSYKTTIHVKLVIKLLKKGSRLFPTVEFYYILTFIPRTEK